MLAVARSSTWPTRQTPASQGRPRCRARPHTPRAWLTPLRRHPDRAVLIHPASPAATCAPGGDASPTQRVSGDEHEPCPRTCPRRMRTACRSAGACRRHPLRCRVGRATGRRWPCRGCSSPCPRPRDGARGNPIAHQGLAAAGAGRMALDRTRRCRKAAAASLFLSFGSAGAAKYSSLHMCSSRRRRPRLISTHQSNDYEPGVRRPGLRGRSSDGYGEPARRDRTASLRLARAGRGRLPSRRKRSDCRR